MDSAGGGAHGGGQRHAESDAVPCMIRSRCLPALAVGVVVIGGWVCALAWDVHVARAAPPGIPTMRVTSPAAIDRAAPLTAALTVRATVLWGSANRRVLVFTAGAPPLHGVLRSMLQVPTRSQSECSRADTPAHRPRSLGLV